MVEKRAISADPKSAGARKARKGSRGAIEAAPVGGEILMDRNETENRIIEAATRLFARDGYREITTKRLAAEAGVNEITLFRRFKSKENILKAVFDLNMEKIEAILDKNLLLEEDADFRVCMRGLCMDIASQAGDLGGMVVSFKKGKEMPLVAASMGSLVRTVSERMCRFFQYHMEAGNIRRANPMTLSMIFFGFIASNNMAKMTPHRMGLPQVDPPPASSSFDDFIGLIMNGIGNDRK
jgi:AcrR family transcriptional regulator